MSNKWTPNQEKAVEARGMQVLVSAAAGSGKTTVLTERVKNILSDTDNRCKVSEILVVTFTRAAATEMRDRIRIALKTALENGIGDSDYLRKQMVLLPTADICTIDSFCAKTVRENFSLADVSVDFELLDEKDSAALMSEALKIVIDDLYEENDESFRKLTTMFLDERDDKQLGDVIKNLYEFSRSYPSPFVWLDKTAEAFNPDKTPDETVWADVIYKYVIMFSDYYYKRLMRSVTLMENSGGFNPNYLKKFMATADRMATLKTSAENRNWDAMVSVIREGLVIKISGNNKDVDEDLKAFTQDVFKKMGEDVEKLEERTFPTTAEHKADCEILFPVVKKLCEAVKRVTLYLDSKKKEKNAYTFDDILHKCIDLLVSFDGDDWTPTPLALEMRERYKEIFIDEYQDTNEAQNIIFEALSRNKENLYCVGDVKQSIYSFRLASPELFMGLRKSLPDYDGEHHPSQITLDKNFRSRKGIDEAVNYIFTALMSEKMGEIDYNHREQLTFGAEYYPDKDTPDVELMCIDAPGYKAADALVVEAEQVAKYVKRILDSKVKITTKQGERQIKSSDICILLRSMKKKSHFFSEALNRYDIPSASIMDGDISDSKEIRFLVALINSISNPLSDIDLIAVMMSPVFGFTVDEVSEIRMTDIKKEMFICLERCAENSVKAKNLLAKINFYRNISASLPIDEFVKYIVKDLSVDDIYSVCSNGEQRRANIKGFLHFAEDFTKSGRKGLSAFVRYIDNGTENESLKAYGVSDSQGVNIMSIHKSKGLEFPYVIIADCAKAFNKQDSYGSLTTSRDTGIGLKIRDDDLFTKYHTTSSAATEKAILFGNASEELRVLYVAMTRAKEHLTFICTVTAESTRNRIRQNNILSRESDGKLHPYAIYKASSYSEWLLTTLATHKDCGIVRTMSSFNPFAFDGESFGIDTVYIDEESLVKSEQEKQTITERVSPDDVIIREIAERAQSEYLYDCSGILAKVTASSLENTGRKKEYFAKRKPDFLNTAFTGADRGNAIHKFLELCDFKAAFETPDDEKNRLLNNGSMSEKELEVLDGETIRAFFSNDVGQRLLNAETIYKEYEFAFLKKAGELYENISSTAAEEDVVVQGKLDCAFIENGQFVIIDYKTDNITDEDVYKTIYSPQLKIYCEALNQCTGLTVKACYIYSFKMKKFIEL